LGLLALERGFGWPLGIPSAEFRGRSLACKVEQLREEGGFGYVTWVEFWKVF
jgi:hypothetical protein